MNQMRYAWALARRDELAREWEAFLAGYDAFLCPVAAVPAFTHRTKGAPIEVDGVKTPYSLAAGAWATLFNLFEGPSVVLPWTRSGDGLPIGLQLIGPRWKDIETLAVAEQIAREVTGDFRPPPGL
jgi:amidase